MKSKEEIVNNWLPRYTGTALEDFGQYVLLTNFHSYLEKFAEWNKVEIQGLERAMPSACLLYTSPSPRDATLSRMPSSA